MHFSRFEIKNYKSLLGPPAVTLKPGFNVVTGQNNAGKTALLEALSLAFDPVPHRSISTVPFPWSQPERYSSAEFALTLSRDELLDRLAGTEDVAVPRPLRGPGNEHVQHLWPNDRPESNAAFVEWFFSHNEFTFEVGRRISRQDGEQWFCPRFPTFGRYLAEQTSEDQYRFFIAKVTPDRRVQCLGGMSAHASSEIGVRMAQIVKGQTYRFSAERFNRGTSRFGNNPVLASNADNLPEVLNILKNNPERFAAFIKTLREVLPQITHVSVPPVDNNTLEIRVWNTDLSTQRTDLAVPLAQSGTGIGQVLAILYVVLNSDSPRIILIDEPQSFLHPGAARKLIEVLKRYPQHQFVLATHSPAIITASNPETITLTKIDGGTTALTELTKNDTAHLQTYLREIGARFSDLFGADNVLWVEGATEETVFPRILAKLSNRSLLGTMIVGVRDTGSFQRRDVRRVLEIYSRLSVAGALLPPAVGFVFDRECHSDQQRADLVRQSDNLLTFIPRRMYENYLLHPRAITEVVNGIPGFRAEALTENAIGQWIADKAGSRDYYCQRAVPGENSVAEVDAARILKELFANFSENRVAYDKVEHAVAITDWLLEHEPVQLREINELLVTILNRATAN